jgi:glycosyltransferase involved in cell wall biosynthesis
MISIVMPSYNSSAFIREAIESLLCQSFPHFELLVCDDASTDDTQQIVQEMARGDSRIRLIVNQHGGISRNCNIGLHEARFPWIARLDADDLSSPERLEIQIKAAEDDPEVVCWGGGALLINRHGRVLRSARIGPLNEADFLDFKRSGRTIYIISPTVMFRREVALAVGGYDPRFDGAEDTELLSRLATRGSLRTLPNIIASYRLHGQSSTAQRSAHQRHLFSFIAARNRAWLIGGDLDLDRYLSELTTRPALERLIDDVTGRGSQYYRNTILHFAEGRIAHGMVTGVLACLFQPSVTSRRFGRRLSRRLGRQLNSLGGLWRNQTGHVSQD